jgi:Peptidase family M48
VNFCSLEKEIAPGKEMAQEVERQARIADDDPVIAEYVNRLGQNLVRNSDAKVPFTIEVIDSEEVNAFALSGGFFFVNSGVILQADNEADLASVMAHEIAHVAARHGTRQATRGEIANLASIPLIFAGGPIGYGVRQAAGLLVPTGFLKFSRAFESEADMLPPPATLSLPAVPRHTTAERSRRYLAPRTGCSSHWSRRSTRTPRDLNVHSTHITELVVSSGPAHKPFAFQFYCFRR